MNRDLPIVRIVTATALASLILAGPVQQASAHHAFEASFDCNAPITLTGKVTMVEWVNPHTWIHVLKAEAGKPDVNWMFVGGTPNSLLRMGVNRDMLKVGTEVTIRGYLAIDRRCLPAPSTGGVATCRAAARAMTLGDGKWTYIGGSGEGAPYDPAQGDNDPPGGQNWGKNAQGPDRAVVSVGTYMKPGSTGCPNSKPPAAP
jgi:hypothetical protein